MNTYMDYSSPLTIIESGSRAFNLGISKEDCPISSRRNANGALWWRNGWDIAAAKTCKGDNCSAKRGIGHSEECIKEHDEITCPEVFIGTRDALAKLKI